MKSTLIPSRQTVHGTVDTSRVAPCLPAYSVSYASSTALLALDNSHQQ
jgi:hypothetical protein